MSLLKFLEGFLSKCIKVLEPMAGHRFFQSIENYQETRIRESGLNYMTTTMTVIIDYTLGKPLPH